MTEIPFTQYLRPNGRPVKVTIKRSTDILARAHYILLKGYRFEIEELMNGQISMTVEKSFQESGPIAHEICKNDPKLPEIVDQLVKTAYDYLINNVFSDVQEN